MDQTEHDARIGAILRNGMRERTDAEHRRAFARDERRINALSRTYVREYNAGNWARAHDAYADLCEMVEWSAESEDGAALAAAEVESLDRDGYLQDY